MKESLAIIYEKESRRRLAALPFAEKIKILERLREMDRLFASAGLRKNKKKEAEGQPPEPSKGTR